jgi:hypothetical protein
VSTLRVFTGTDSLILDVTSLELLEPTAVGRGT